MFSPRADLPAGVERVRMQREISLLRARQGVPLPICRGTRVLSNLFRDAR